MSLYLFVIAREVLIVCIKKFNVNRYFKYHWQTKSIFISLLIFIDNLMIFCKRDKNSISLLLQGFNLTKQRVFVSLLI